MLRAMLRWFVALAGVAGRARRIRGTGPCRPWVGSCAARRPRMRMDQDVGPCSMVHIAHVCVEKRARVQMAFVIIFITGVYLNLFGLMVYLETARRSPAISSTFSHFFVR